MRRIHRDLGVDANRHGCADTSPCRDLVDEQQLTLGLDVQEEDARIECLRQLQLRLADTAEDDLVAGEAGSYSAKQLAPGDDICTGSQIVHKSQDGAVGICLERIVNSV